MLPPSHRIILSWFCFVCWAVCCLLFFRPHFFVVLSFLSFTRKCCPLTQPLFLPIFDVLDGFGWLLYLRTVQYSTLPVLPTAGWEPLIPSAHALRTNRQIILATAKLKKKREPIDTRGLVFVPPSTTSVRPLTTTSICYFDSTVCFIMSFSSLPAVLQPK